MTACRLVSWTTAILLAASLAPGAYAKDTIKSLENRRIEVPTGGQIDASADKARDSYRRFLELVSDDPELRAEAMRRLADLELEATEVEQLSSEFDMVDSAGHASAVSLFQQLLDSYPDYRRNDTVLYQLARAHELGGRTDDALRVLDELVTRYPETAIIDEVQFRRGEILFLQKDYYAAESAYRNVVTHGVASRFYEQSLYKLGWSLFKQAEHEQSLDPFFDLLDRKLAGVAITDGEERLDALGRAERELVEDTFRVLSISFSYLDGPASIAPYLDKRRQPSYGYVIFMNLGNLYLEKERYVDAAQTFEAFVEQDPNHQKAPLLQVAVIEAYKRGEFPTLVLEGKKRFVERYGMDGPFWQRNAREDNASVAAHLKENLNDVAQFYHAEAQKDGKRPAYQEAARWYRKYLDYFPGEPDSANTNFLLAEILFESGDFEAATLEYERSAYNYPRHEHSAEAAYAALLAYRKHEANLAGAAQFEWHRRYLDSGLRFADAYPEHPESTAVLTTVAEDLFQQNQFDLAIAVARKVVTHEPPVDEKLALTAWTVIAHAQFDLGDFAAAEQAYYQLRPLTPRDDSVARREVEDRIASSIYKQGELARDSGDLEQAVVHFTRLGDVVPNSEFRMTAEYDAAAALINLQSWDRASAVLESFRRSYPDSDFAGDVTAKLAVSYLESGRSAEAAGEFERIADSPDSDPDVQREALWKAAELYRSGSAYAGEERVLVNFVRRFPNPVAESIEARHRLLELAGERGDRQARTERLRDLVDADATAGSQRSDRTRYLAATSTLELAEPLRREFATAVINQPLADSLKRKKRLMEDVLAAYGRAADYGVAEVTTAATFRLGEVYQRFSADLMESERPLDLDELALEQYELLLEEQAFPFEEKAIELYEVNAARAADGIYDDWVQKSFTALAALLPARYAKLERSEHVVTALY